MVLDEMHMCLRYYSYRFVPPVSRREGWVQSQPRLTRISKTMSQILRHKGQALNVPIRSDGYALVDDLLQCSWMTKFNVTLEELQQIVSDNDKQRFSLSQENNVWYVRANQGHSIPIDDMALLTKLHPDTLSPDMKCVHGTYFRYWPAISKQGLRAGGKQGVKFRTHIHFAPDIREGVISGMRGGCDVVIYVDLKRALLDGLEFYQSSNGVILSRGFPPHHDLPAHYFTKVVHKHGKTETIIVGTGGDG
eukprot:GEMP01063986.1.p1 GENE.GEMP01063986.1~~GEMP01063986.1.p1  ORF type:complete len:268 (+),score=24.64 GEMP01063986.1:60-806(+)